MPGGINKSGTRRSTCWRREKSDVAKKKLWRMKMGIHTEKKKKRPYLSQGSWGGRETFGRSEERGGGRRKESPIFLIENNIFHLKK